MVITDALPIATSNGRALGAGGVDKYRAAAELFWGDAGTWAYDTFDQLNADYFARQVPCRGIAWGLTPHGHRLGHTASSGRITLHPALLDPHSDAWRLERFLGVGYAREVLLHEMIHALLFARGDLPEHNARPWCDEVMRLAPLLGLGPVQAAPVQPRRVDGKVVRQAERGYMSRVELAGFPHTLRPREWYEAQRERLPVPI